jgi:hypothetical protein
MWVYRNHDDTEWHCYFVQIMRVLPEWLRTGPIFGDSDKSAKRNGMGRGRYRWQHEPWPALSLLSFASALSGFALNFMPGSYSWLSVLVFCLWLLTIFLGFAMFGRKGFWLLLGAPFALAFLAVVLMVAMGGLDKM